MRSGVVVAGGRSTRFGPGDKALAEFDGEPLVRRVADSVGAAVDELVVNGRVDQMAGFRDALDGVPVRTRYAIDDEPDRGPVAGMANGLRAVDGTLAVVTPCDMPTLDPDFLDSLFHDAADRLGAVPLFDGQRQPFPGVYRVAPATDACRGVLRAGDGSLQAVLDRLEPVVVPEATVRERTEPSTFRNVNTPADLRE